MTSEKRSSRLSFKNSSVISSIFGGSSSHQTESTTRPRTIAPSTAAKTGPERSLSVQNGANYSGGIAMGPITQSSPPQTTRLPKSPNISNIAAFADSPSPTVPKHTPSMVRRRPPPPLFEDSSDSLPVQIPEEPEEPSHRYDMDDIINALESEINHNGDIQTYTPSPPGSATSPLKPHNGADYFSSDSSLVYDSANSELNKLSSEEDEDEEEYGFPETPSGSDNSLIGASEIISPPPTLQQEIAVKRHQSESFSPLTSSSSRADSGSTTLNPSRSTSIPFKPTPLNSVNKRSWVTQNPELVTSTSSVNSTLPEQLRIHRKSASVSSAYSFNVGNVPNLTILKQSLNLKPGEGERSSYVLMLRKNGGTAFNDTVPIKWKLPMGIRPIDSRTAGRNRGHTTNQRFNPHKSGVELKHGHLKPRMLASEIDENDDNAREFNFTKTPVASLFNEDMGGSVRDSKELHQTTTSGSFGTPNLNSRVVSGANSIKSYSDDYGADSGASVPSTPKSHRSNSSGSLDEAKISNFYYQHNFGGYYMDNEETSRENLTETYGEDDEEEEEEDESINGGGRGGGLMLVSDRLDNDSD